jgi:hypothetical protein
LCVPGALQAAKVSRITGYSDKASEKDERIQTAEQIESALKIIQEKDLRSYNTLIKIRISNFDKFLADLQQWIDEDNPSKAGREKKRLNNLLRKIDFELVELSQALSKETDDIKKVELQNQICLKVSERISAELEQEKFFVRLKKMELGYEETNLIQKIRNREMKEKELLSRYIPETEGEEIS